MLSRKLKLVEIVAKDTVPRTPNDTHRVAIVGQNGTGKSVAGVYHLAWRSYDRMPWLIVDYKGDEYLAAIGAERMDIGEKIPKEPGLYHVMAQPAEGSIDGLLWRAWSRGNVGIYIDECYGVGQHSQAFRNVLTQGRALHVPVILCTQRPVWISKFALSEANFWQVFPLTGQDDRKTVSQWTGVDVNYPETLPEYCSHYYDAAKRRSAMLGPVPFGAEVLDIFDRRRPKKHRRI